VIDALRAPFAGVLGLLLAVAGWLFGGRPSRGSILPATVGAVGAALPLVMGGDWMPGHRFVVPYLPLLAVTVSLGWARLLVRARRGGTGLLSVLLLASAPLCLALQWGDRARLADTAATETAGARTGHGALAAWLRSQAAPGDAIVLMDIGEVGYRCIEQRIVDVTGLTDRTIGRSPGTFMDKRFDLAYVWAQKPRFIVLTYFGGNEATAPLYPSSPMEERLAADPTFQRDYLRPRDPPEPTQGAYSVMEQLLSSDTIPISYSTPGRKYLLGVFRRKN
jgi:hypothetical protein